MFIKHEKIETNATLLLILSLIVVTIGGLVQIVPLFYLENVIEKVDGMRPYTPLELAGRNIYIREGCYACHSQMIRTLRDEVERYGPYSLAVESKYDHPMLWGSKRTGPDLARIGEKYSDVWQVRHLVNPRELVPPSVMPEYAFLLDTPLETASLPKRLAALRDVGVPYTDDMIANAVGDAVGQSLPDSDAATALVGRYGEATTVRSFDGRTDMLTEMDALVAYLQVLGRLTDLPQRVETMPEE